RDRWGLSNGTFCISDDELRSEPVQLVGLFTDGSQATLLAWTPGRESRMLAITLLIGLLALVSLTRSFISSSTAQQPLAAESSRSRGRDPRRRRTARSDRARLQIEERNRSIAWSKRLSDRLTQIGGQKNVGASVQCERRTVRGSGRCLSLARAAPQAE